MAGERSGNVAPRGAATSHASCVFLSKQQSQLSVIKTHCAVRLAQPATFIYIVLCLLLHTLGTLYVKIFS
jgi:hypothetical protein